MRVTLPRDGIYKVSVRIGGVETEGFATVRDGVVIGLDTLSHVSGALVAVDEDPAAVGSAEPALPSDAYAKP